MLYKESTNLLPPYLEAAKQLRANPGQWKAYQSSGNCVILAGPGSGKTKLLTTKMAQILSEDIKSPQGIACITYSAECARELKQRLDLLGVEESQNIFIGTVHGFCLNTVVRPYANLAGLNIPKDIVIPDDNTWGKIFQKAMTEKGIQEHFSTVKLRIEKYRRTFLNRDSKEWREKDEETAMLIEHFENLLHSQGFLDFDDMVLMGLQLIKNYKWVRDVLHARFPVLIVDEYQDLGAPLHQMVLNLCFRAGVRLIAVGDPDQSIYGFTGADPQLLRNLTKISNIQVVNLELNYRCGKTIVASSIKTLGEQRNYQSALQHEGEITFWECSQGIEEQAETICSRIIPQALASGKERKLGDIAVLYLNKYDASEITKAVKRHDYQYIGGDKDTRYPTTPLTRWLEDSAAWCCGGWRMGVPRLSSLMNFWLTLHGSYFTDRHLRQTFVSFLWKHRDPRQRLENWLYDLSKQGLEEILEKNTTLTDEKKVLKELCKAAANPKKLGDFTIGDFGGLRGSSEHLNLLTLHSSKGLEFDVVIMMGMDQGRIPPWGTNSPESKRESRRLFYVGLTRARHEVHLVYSGWYKNAYGTIFNSGPSEFVTDLRNYSAFPEEETNQDEEDFFDFF